MSFTGFVQKVWKDTIADYPTRRVLHDVTHGTDQVVTVTRSIGTISQEGDVFDAQTMNDMEGRIGDAFDALDTDLTSVENNLSSVKSNLTTLFQGTISASSTSVTISNSAIRTTSVIDIYFQNKALSPTAVSVSNGSITITIEKQSTQTVVGVRVFNA